jgi:hypothetical protein
MASTYTSELRIEKIATGEQSGTWGTTTNTQYDLWEAAISGTSTVAFASDGNDTLGTANGSDDEARHMFIDLTGGSTLTATREMVVPTSSKLYFVRNNTTGSQSVTIKTTAGTGITVGNGEYMALYCDGTNVIDAFDAVNLSRATITGGSITGITDLAVADGGTGASTLTDGGVLLGSGTGAITAMSVLADGEFIVGDGTTDPVAESGATARTSMGVGTGDSPQLTGIELGHATDTTITRSAAGIIAVEGVAQAAATGVNATKQVIAIALGDETTATAAATAVATFHMPYAFTLTDVKAGVTTAPTGSVLTVDINEAGSTILSTKITIDAGEKTSGTAATAPVISDSSLAVDALITIDVDGVGSTVAGAGLKVYLIGYIT